MRRRHSLAYGLAGALAASLAGVYLLSAVDAGAPGTATVSVAYALDGSCSGASTCQWSKIAGAGSCVFEDTGGGPGACDCDATACDLDVTCDTSAAAVTLELDCGTSSDTVAIEVNSAPVANAGADTGGVVGVAFALDASCTDDGRPAVPGATTCQWSKTAGSGTCTFEDVGQGAGTCSCSAGGCDLDVTCDTASTFTLQLLCDDGPLTHSDTASHTVVTQDADYVADLIAAVGSGDVWVLYSAHTATTTTWPDSGPNANDLSGTNTPTPSSTGFAANSRPRVSFDDSLPEYYSKSSGVTGLAAGDGALACFVVYSADDTGARNTTLDSRTAVATEYVIRFRQENDATPALIPRIWAQGDGTSTEIVGPQGSAVATDEHLTEVWLSDTDGLAHVRTKGAGEVTADVSDTAGLVKVNHTPTRIWIGATVTVDAGWSLDGDVATVFCFKNSTSSERAAVVTRMEQYYGEDWTP